MCGIIAVIEKQERPVNQKLFQEALKEIKHRGPDSQGFVCSGNIGLGHTRLSIVDLTDNSNQPIHSDYGVLIFNGEIYNYKDLALKYGLSELAYRSDTLFLLEYLSQYENYHELRGMFAFVYYDKRTKDLSVVRDQLGVKPIYYFESRDCYIFSSEIKPILRYSGIKVELNKAALSDHILLGYSQCNETLFKHIHRVPEGSRFLVRGGKIVKTRYFKLNEIDTVNLDLKEFLPRVLKSHLMSDVSIGMMLSGGVDSSLMASILSRDLRIKDFKCFNAGDIHSRNSSLVKERHTALKLTEKLGLDLVKIPIDSKSLVGLSEYIVHAEEPIANSGALLLGKICQVAEAKVILSGHGGDEAYAGYRRHRVTRFYDRYKFLMRIFPIALFFRYTKNWFSSDIRRVMSSLVSPSRIELSLSAIGLKSFEDSWLKDGIVNLESTIERFYVDIKKEEKSKLKRLQYKEYSGYLAAQNLIVADKLSMAYSKELRVPFIYPELAGHGLSMDSGDMFKRFTGKQPLRKLLEGYEAEDVLVNKKSGFSPDMNTILSSEESINLLTGERTALRGIVNIKNIEVLLSNLEVLSSEDKNQLFNLAVIEAWMREYLDV